MVQRGRRAVYEPAAVAFEKPTPTNETEYRRKVRMFEHCWLIVLRGKMLRRRPPGYLVALVSHRHLRYASGLLHVVLLATSLALVDARHGSTTSCSPASSCCSPRPPPASGSRATTCSSRWATVVALWNYLRRGVPATWAAARRGRAEPQRSTSRSPAPALVAREPGARGRRRSRSSSATAARCSTGRRASARTARDFELLKLRTMVVGAEKIGRRATRSTAGDSRITRAGRLLRRLSLDELPQLWNVVRGEMSVIGPRPTLRYQVDRYDERQRHRLDVKPGITGWAQIHGRAEAAVGRADRARPLVRRAPLAGLDLKILLRTPLALFGGTYKGETGGWTSAD